MSESIAGRHVWEVACTEYLAPPLEPHERGGQTVAIGIFSSLQLAKRAAESACRAAYGCELAWDMDDEPDAAWNEDGITWVGNATAPRSRRGLLCFGQYRIDRRTIDLVEVSLS